MRNEHDSPLHRKLLRRRVEINRQEREREKALKGWLESRMKDIQSAPMRVHTSFFCDQCDADFDGIGFKQVRWPRGTVWLAYYLGFCPKGHPNVRRITDKLNDPYFYKSYVIRKEQSKHADLFLPHWHPRFKYVYPEQWVALQARRKEI